MYIYTHTIKFSCCESTFEQQNLTSVATIQFVEEVEIGLQFTY